MSDKCPFCGAEKVNPPQYAMDYECGHIDKPGFRHEVCAMRQIANLKERLEAWRELGNSIIHPNDYELKPAFRKLKNLGEI